MKKRKARSSKSRKSSSRLTQKDFQVEDLGKNTFPTPLKKDSDFFEHAHQKIFYNNFRGPSERLTHGKVLTFDKPGPYKMLHFDPKKCNVGIVTCGGLCPGLNDVIRAVTYASINIYNVKMVYGFKYGYEGLTSKYAHTAVSLTPDGVDEIHEIGGSYLASSRGEQSIEDMVDTLVKYNISILFVVGGDGTQRGSMRLAAEIKRRKLDIAIIGIPKTIDNDLSYVHSTFGFATAVEEARKAVIAAHVEAKGTRNGIGLVRLMGRAAGFIAAHVTIASGCVNMCLIPEKKRSIDEICKAVEKRFKSKEHIVIVVAEGFGQDILQDEKHKEYDASGNLKLKDIGPFLKTEVSTYLKQKGIPHTVRYIDPSYIIRSVRANAYDASFCLRLGNFAVHAGMAGKTNCIIGFWNQHFTLTPIKLAISKKKQVELNSTLWQTIEEITV